MKKYRYLLQKKIEETFGKKFIVGKACEDIMSTDYLIQPMNQSLSNLRGWLQEDHEESKELRLLALHQLDLAQLVQEVVVLIALHTQTPLKLVSIASMCASHLKMADKVEAIHTMAEVIAVMQEDDLYTVSKTNNGWVVETSLQLDEEVVRYAINSFYLPPMLIKPRTVRHNRDSGYITQRGESLILGRFENHHDDDISLDVINVQNANEYELDMDYICSQQEDWHQLDLSQEEYDELSNEQKKLYDMDSNAWNTFQEESYKIQTLMYYHGNSFYLQNKVDKRGRLYTSGYHISPQGSSHKKAMINLKHKELVTGLKDW